jgi:CheY-like chemotaxis protein
MLAKFVHVLLLDPDEQTAGLFANAFQRRWPHYPLTVTGDEIAALDLLRCGDPERAAPPPHLILLNLNRPQPGSDLSFLRQLRQDPVLRRRPVFVFGHSSRTEDILAVYDFVVAGYVVWANIDHEYQSLFDLLDAYISAVEFCEL